MAAIRILKYLKKEPDLGLFYPVDNPYLVTGYSDADWGSCGMTCRSVFGEVWCNISYLEMQKIKHS